MFELHFITDVSEGIHLQDERIKSTFWDVMPSEGIIAAIFSSTIFWDMTPCTILHVSTSLHSMHITLY
jgi:hypothetical protein